MNFPMNNTTSSVPLIPFDMPILRLIIAFLCIVLYLFGYTGCLLSIVTFSSKKLRRHSTGFLFLVMACVDLFNLIASLQYFLDVIYQIKIMAWSIHWCRFFTIFNYELYFGFSWIFAFISVDRWIKVEWPSKSQTLCTRRRFIYLCLLTLALSLIQNVIYTLTCISNQCDVKNLACEIFVHTIYISLYMTVPIAIILISICRTCLITLHVKKRFRTSTAEVQRPLSSVNNTETSKHLSITIDQAHQSSTLTTHLSSSSSVPTATSNKARPSFESQTRLANYSTYLRRRHTGLDAQMVMLISINVAPFIFVHIINEIAYLFERYSMVVAQSQTAQLLIVLIYLSWYLISATRFYTNCLLSRIYREEFKTRLYALRYGCKPRLSFVTRAQSSRCNVTNVVNGPSSAIIPITANKSIGVAL